MLADAAIERYSRQILLPDVGGLGQERLAATRVIVSGDDPAAAFAATLVAAAGATVVCRPGVPGTLEATVGGVTIVARAHGGGGMVMTLLGRPCLHCVGERGWDLRPAAATAVDPALAQTLGGLVAGEALRAALGLVALGRVQTVDLAGGAFDGRPIPATDGCAACAGAP
jgi:hypothetical protein